MKKGFKIFFGMAVALAMLLAIMPAGALLSVLATGGTGDEGNPYLIGTAAELAAMGARVNDGTEPARKYYQLTADIDLSAYGAGYNGGAGWVPIGANYAFSGHFDGKGHKITGLYINITNGTSDAGLFGRIQGATVQNLGVEGVNITGKGAAGGLAASVYGTLTNCYVTGTVSGTDKVGGLAGSAGGSISNCHAIGAVNGVGSRWDGSGSIGGLLGNSGDSITDCYTSVAVTAEYCDDIGGLVGACSSGSIERCYTTGTVVGVISVGGLAGVLSDNSHMTDCYTTGIVTGDGWVGGLVGRVITTSSITNCYTTGAIFGEISVGGLAGYVSDSNMTNCAALNPSVKALFGENEEVFNHNLVGRIRGEGSNPTLSGNIAFSGMSTDGGASFGPIANDATDKNGLGKTLAQLQELSGFPAGFGAAPWTYEPGRLPGLNGETVPMPSHLGGVTLPNVALQVFAPTTGEAPVTASTITANVSVFETTWQVKNGDVWSAHSGRFEAGKAYRCTVVVHPTGDYVFSESAAVTINGVSATVTSRTPQAITCVYVFGLTAAPIQSVDLYSNKPWRAGSTATAARASTANVLVSETVWQVEENGLWEPFPGVFDVGNYRCTVTVHPANGYTFAENATVTMGYETLTVLSRTPQSITCAYEAVVKANDIFSLSLSITAPAGGAMPAQATTSSTNVTAPETTWQVNHNGTWVPHSGVFVIGKVYRCTIVARAADYCVFLQNASATLNNTTPTIVSRTPKAITVTHDFVLPGTMNNVALTITAPVPGELPADASTTTANISEVATTWLVVNGSFMSVHRGAFEAGKTYCCVITAKSVPEYAFIVGTVVTLNGNPPMTVTRTAQTINCSYDFTTPLHPKGDITLDDVVDTNDILAVRAHMFGTGKLIDEALSQAQALCVGEPKVIDIDVILAIRSLMFGA